MCLFSSAIGQWGARALERQALLYVSPGSGWKGRLSRLLCPEISPVFNCQWIVVQDIRSFPISGPTLVTCLGNTEISRRSSKLLEVTLGLWIRLSKSYPPAWQAHNHRVRDRGRKGQVWMRLCCEVSMLLTRLTLEDGRQSISSPVLKVWLPDQWHLHYFRTR